MNLTSVSMGKQGKDALYPIDAQQEGGHNETKPARLD